MSNIGVQNVINQGLNLMQHSLTEEQYQIWLEYSKSMLALASNNQNIMMNYMQVILSASNPLLAPYTKPYSIACSTIFTKIFSKMSVPLNRLS